MCAGDNQISKIRNALKPIIGTTVYRKIDKSAITFTDILKIYTILITLQVELFCTGIELMEVPTSIIE